MKRSILAFGLLGLVGCFLPLVAGLSWFEIRHFDQGWTVWAVLAAFAIPTFVGASSSETDRTAALVGTACFGYLAYKFGTGVFDLVVHASLGGIMMGVAVVGGLASSLLALSGSRRV
ncbi:MAG TPA: hypothetical protein VIV40_31705 [Kofleriaceae bacterium]